MLRSNNFPSKFKFSIRESSVNKEINYKTHRQGTSNLIHPGLSYIEFTYFPTRDYSSAVFNPN